MADGKLVERKTSNLPKQCEICNGETALHQHVWYQKMPQGFVKERVMLVLCEACAAAQIAHLKAQVPTPVAVEQPVEQELKKAG